MIIAFITEIACANHVSRIIWLKLILFLSIRTDYKLNEQMN